MDTSLENKSTIKDIKERFDKDVKRFSKIQTGQQNLIDAALVMELITQAAAQNNTGATRILDIGCGAGNNTIKLLDDVGWLDCDLVYLSQHMLDRAVGRIGPINEGKVRTFQDDCRTASLPEDQYDISIAAAVLH